MKIFRQALALDERRVKYKPDFWYLVPEAGEQRAFPGLDAGLTNVLEVWFAGNHSGNGQLEGISPRTSRKLTNSVIRRYRGWVLPGRIAKKHSQPIPGLDAQPNPSYTSPNIL